MGFKQFIKNNWRLVNSNTLSMNRCVNSVIESYNMGYAKKAVVENTLQLPKRPKKPNPPFFLYLQEKRQEVTEKHNLSLKDAVRVVSEMWKNVDSENKQKMNEVYNKELEKYKKNVELYKQSLTEDQKNELFRLKYEQIEQRTKRKLKKELKDLGKPRKPLTAYLMFVSEEIKNHGNVPVQIYMTTIANKWKEMDENTKSKFIKAALQENDKYNNALLDWENKMIKAGRLDLVRPRALSNDNIDIN
ncbi:transcription factor A, mitochondrial [Sipha flava]|uniref:Transcription factor A, mitochondrial n=1 Tax=Sipha flava TaxID=143950 RepID=A0A8B8FJC5_9HEMI|nr:transcription factor A, mitochondrial [Sipha flava]